MALVRLLKNRYKGEYVVTFYDFDCWLVEAGCKHMLLNWFSG